MEILGQEKTFDCADGGLYHCGGAFGGALIGGESFEDGDEAGYGAGVVAPESLCRDMREDNVEEV